MAAGIDYTGLVLKDRVHGTLYTDPDVFEDEIERMWYQQWVYIGHESEAPEPGTYARKSFGLQPVIMTRDEAGEVHVLFNRCAHLAQMLCHEKRGSARAFRCPFHGWTYSLDGQNRGVPFAGGYGADFDKSEHNLASPARVESHRGFVFATMNVDGPDLLEYLGPTAAEIDNLCDLSPVGELELNAGWIKHKVKANWKLGYEGALDGYHPRFVHRSLISLTKGSNFEQANDNCAAGVRSFPYGHGDVDWPPYYQATGQDFVWIGGSREKMPNYTRALEQAHGDERAAELITGGPPHVMIAPNLFIAELFIMVLEPVAANCHNQIETPILWKGADELNERNMRQTNASIGPAGMVLADDAAMIERNQQGLAAGQPEWMIRKRGAHRRKYFEDGTTHSKMTDDGAILGFWEYYREVMSANGSDGDGRNGGS